MPYNKISELPDAVKALPTTALQEAWMKAYNGARKQYGDDEAKCMGTAWAVIKQMGYVKKDDKWVKAEKGYIKDLGLAVGKFPHPTLEGETLDLTLAKLEDYVKNSEDFLNKGGKIPLTISHPKNESEKIELTDGHVESVWLDYGEQKPYGYVTLLDNAKSDKWIEEGKLTAVSPGVYTGVKTALGTYPSLIDHVAATSSPFFPEQKEFIPVNAESFSSGYIFFENKCLMLQKTAEKFKCECIKCSYKMDSEEHCKDIECPKCGGEMRRVERPGPGQSFESVSKLLKDLKQGIITLFESFGNNGEDNKDEQSANKEDDDMKELEELQTKYADLEKKLGDITTERDNLKEQIQKVEAAQTKKSKDEFEARVDKLTDEGKILPAEKDGVMVTFEAMKTRGDVVKLGDEEKPIADVVLAPFESRPSKLKVGLKDEIDKVQIGELVFEIMTLEGRNKLSDHIAERAKKENKPYSEMRETVFAEAGIKVQLDF